MLHQLLGDFSRLDVGSDAAVGPDDDLGVLQMNFAFDLAVHVKVFAAADLTADGV